MWFVIPQMLPVLNLEFGGDGPLSRPGRKLPQELKQMRSSAVSMEIAVWLQRYRPSQQTHSVRAKGADRRGGLQS